MIETHSLLWDFEVQTDHPIPARRPDLVTVNKKKKENQPTCSLCHPGELQGENKEKTKRETNT